LVPERRLQTELTWEFQFPRNDQPEKIPKTMVKSKREGEMDYIF